MKHTSIKISISIFFLLLILCCKDQTLVYKPKNLIDELTMENIIYEAIMMDVMSTFKPKNKKFIGIVGSPYLFLKYNIDSLQLVRSNEYYKKSKVMSKIYGSIEENGKSKDILTILKLKKIKLN